MKKAHLFLFLGFILLGAAIFWGGKLIALLPKKPAFSGLHVEALPESWVFLNEKELGKTPFEDENLLPGEYTLRLIPETTASFSAWEKKIKLNPGLLTYASYIFSPSESQSVWELLTLEKIGNEKGEIVVLSGPDGASVSLDGQAKGVTPISLAGFSNEEHDLNFSLPGYHSRSLKIKTLSGHKLLVSVKLAKIPEEISPVASVSAGLKVRVLETPTGWLRVRSEPSLTASEAAKIEPGKEYELLEESQGWFRIQYQEGKEGWILGQYAQKTQ